MINNNIYIVDYNALIRQLLPSILRKLKLIAFIKSLIAPIITLYSDFIVFKDQAIYKSEHNGSVTLLQKALNDAFDPTNRGIYINNALLLDSEHYYDESNGDPLYFFDELQGPPQFFYDPEGYNVYGSDFTVFLPGSIRPTISNEENRLIIKISGLLDYYKIYGTKYTIVWLN